MDFGAGLAVSSHVRLVCPRSAVQGSWSEAHTPWTREWPGCATGDRGGGGCFVECHCPVTSPLGLVLPARRLGHSGLEEAGFQAGADLHFLPDTSGVQPPPP